MRRLPGVLYLLTSLATLSTGLTFFAEDYAALTGAIKSRIRVPASLAILDFAAPALFLLASALSFWTKKESNRGRWITVAAVLIMLAPLIHGEHGWKLFVETAGPLVCAVLILDSMMRWPSAIAMIASVMCGITQGQMMIYGIERYWDFGGSISTFLVEITPLSLVTASLIAAIAHHLAMRKSAVGQAKS
jgi:hypothetical protein